MFDFLLRPVRACSAWLMPGLAACRRDTVSFVLLLLIWLALGVGKMLLVVS